MVVPSPMYAVVADRSMRADDGAGADRNPRTDDAICTDNGTVGDNGIGGDDRGVVNARCVAGVAGGNPHSRAVAGNRRHRIRKQRTHFRIRKIRIVNDHFITGRQKT